MKHQKIESLTHTPLFAVRLEDALKVRGFISKEPARYYLNGIHIEAGPEGGAIAAATDGHRLGASYSPDGLVNESCIISVPALLKPEKAFMREWLVGVRLGDNGYIAVVPGHKNDNSEDTAEHAMERVEQCRIRFGQALIDGTFPDWRRVIPSVGADVEARTFNREYLRSFGDNITIAGGDNASPHLVSNGDSNFIGVLMPMRGDTRVAVPEWLQAAKQDA